MRAGGSARALGTRGGGVVLRDVAGGRLRRRANVSLMPADASASARSEDVRDGADNAEAYAAAEGLSPDEARERLEELLA